MVFEIIHLLLQILLELCLNAVEDDLGSHAVAGDGCVDDYEGIGYGIEWNPFEAEGVVCASVSAFDEPVVGCEIGRASCRERV